MSNRAVLHICDDIGASRRLYAAWASPQFQVPLVAEMVRHLDQHGRDLTVANVLAWGIRHPGLPDEDITQAGWFASPDDWGDLSYRYELTLSAAEPGVRYLIRTRQDNPLLPAGFELIEGRTELYTRAAEYSERMIGHLRRRGGPERTYLPEWESRRSAFRWWIRTPARRRTAPSPDDTARQAAGLAD
ncbi:hypothetical protein GCM10022220_43390 [Actinocatenispora rupis]